MPSDHDIHLNSGETYRDLKRYNLALSEHQYALR